MAPRCRTSGWIERIVELALIWRPDLVDRATRASSTAAVARAVVVATFWRSCITLHNDTPSPHLHTSLSVRTRGSLPQPAPKSQQ